MCKEPKKKRRRTKSSSEMTRGDAYKVFRSFGTGYAAQTGLSPPQLPVPDGLRTGFLDRALDESTGKLVVKKATFGSRYRSTWDAQDELFSTASTRSFIEGLLGNKSKKSFDSDLWETWTEAVDLFSRLRIPTKYSGFATSKGVMQHPTGEEGFFSSVTTSSAHSTMDTERVKYIARRKKAAQDAGMSLDEQLKLAARSAIEFTLNHFTAPITASDVQPFTPKAGIAHTDTELLAQIAARDRLKELYVELGGSLRDLDGEETHEEALARPWQTVPGITVDEPYPVAPPSPLRKASKKKRRLDEDLSEPLPVNSLLTAAPLDERVGPPLKRARASVGPSSSPLMDAFASRAGLFDFDPLAQDDDPQDVEDLSDFMLDPVVPEYWGQFEPSAPPQEDEDEIEYDQIADFDDEMQAFADIMPSAPPMTAFEQWLDGVDAAESYGAQFIPSAPPQEDLDEIDFDQFGSFDDEFLGIADVMPSALPMTAFQQQVDAADSDEEFWANFDWPSVPTSDPILADDVASEAAVDEAALGMEVDAEAVLVLL